jgi:hypothetical protein
MKLDFFVNEKDVIVNKKDFNEKNLVIEKKLNCLLCERIGKTVAFDTVTQLDSHFKWWHWGYQKAKKSPYYSCKKCRTISTQRHNHQKNKFIKKLEQEYA